MHSRASSEQGWWTIGCVTCWNCLILRENLIQHDFIQALEPALDVEHGYTAPNVLCSKWDVWTLNCQHTHSKSYFTWSRVWLLHLSPESPIARGCPLSLPGTSPLHLPVVPRTDRTGARCNSAQPARSPVAAWNRSNTPGPGGSSTRPAHSGRAESALTEIGPQRSDVPEAEEPEFGRNMPLGPSETRSPLNHPQEAFSTPCCWKVSAPEARTERAPWRLKCDTTKPLIIRTNVIYLLYGTLLNATQCSGAWNWPKCNMNTFRPWIEM